MTISNRGAVSRRRAIVVGGAGAAAVGLGAAGCGSETTSSEGAVSEGATSSAGGDEICLLTPEVTAGPYYLDDQLIREDITEGKPGIPLTLEITVVDYSDDCAPVTGDDVAVEIWHCDAYGYYSGYTDADPGGEGPPEDGEGDENSFLRGVRMVDGEGTAHFSTIVPGVYLPRVAHIHLQVHAGGEAGTTYEGGTTVHTGQLLFPNEFAEMYVQYEPYSDHQVDLVPLEDDGLYQNSERNDGEAAAGSMVVTPVSVTEDNPEDGYTVSVVVAIDPSTESATASGSGAPDDAPGGGASEVALEGDGEPPAGGSEDDAPADASDGPADPAPAAGGN